jgi:hypothetical protein
MAEDEWYKPHHGGLGNEPRVPRPGEPVWTLTKNGRRVDCELRFQGESYGWEVQFLHDGVMAYGQRFVVREHAAGEAEHHRERLMRDGWTAPVMSHPAK